MCIIAWAQGAVPEYPLILVANRDELWDRETSQATFWKDAPSLLGGRDLRRGGTWLGITKQGRFAAITNYRVPFSDIRADAKSRGDLLNDFLLSSKEINTFSQELEDSREEYNGFNLLFGHVNEPLYHFNSVSTEGVEKLEPKKVYVVTNAFLDTPWPKAVLAKNQFEEIIENLKRNPSTSKQELTEILFSSFSSLVVPPLSALPSTGVGERWETALGSIFVHFPSEEYGTRSQVVLLVDAQGNVSFVEQSKVLPSLSPSEPHELSQELPPSARVFTHVDGREWIRTHFEFPLES